MAKNLSVVSLSKGAQDAVARAMRRRGESPGSYYSTPGVSEVSPVAAERGGVPYEDPVAATSRYLASLYSGAGVREARSQLGTTRLLFSTPAEAYGKTETVRAKKPAPAASPQAYLRPDVTASDVRDMPSEELGSFETMHMASLLPIEEKLRISGLFSEERRRRFEKRF